MIFRSFFIKRFQKSSYIYKRKEKENYTCVKIKNEEKRKTNEWESINSSMNRQSIQVN